ncbi:MAG: SDR family oxidoreductase [Candidatus Latescibacteria bacterium]|nr:SDR family oxidoreductase [Candidatus Latescibacterota bacterium]
MRILVTGGAGFLGSHLCEFLLAQEHEVVVMDNLLTGRAENIAHLIGHKGFTFLDYDVTNFVYVTGDLDYILHFASPASPKDYLVHSIHTMKVGAIGTYRTLGLARVKGARFLLASTSEAYGDPLVHPQPESYWGNVNPIGVRGVYDEAKRFAEAMTMAYHREVGIDTRIVRIFNTYGPRMRKDDGRAIPNFISQALSGDPITIYGDGTQTRSICYVSDLVAGIYRLMESDHIEPVNIGNPTEMTILELAQQIVKITGSKSEIIHQEAMLDDPKVRQPDITLARQLLGWEPKVRPEEGLEKTVEWFREN